jgi:hypothetical protein
VVQVTGEKERTWIVNKTDIIVAAHMIQCGKKNLQRIENYGFKQQFGERARTVCLAGRRALC